MGGKMLVGAHDGFNKMSCLEMLWNVRHHWPAGERFTLNFYKHWVLILLHHPGGGGQLRC